MRFTSGRKPSVQHAVGLVEREVLPRGSRSTELLLDVVQQAARRGDDEYPRRPSVRPVACE
jgi:hypothetical protein